ncbi:peptidoglycan DD-metalloendopeptidase family protein [Actinoplanes sp. NPDC051470]|uniref:peptidoglycan DD-metalloendopeptidase family protein n=1 Tax=Actinoplanes sp. NPDC051470 TaxID=3157224 RepID=UPI00342DA959
MKARHQRRISTTLLAAAGILAGALGAAGPVAAAPKVAGIGTAKTGGTALNLRVTPASAGKLAGTVSKGGKLSIVCQVRAETIRGTVRTTNLWDKLTNNYWVADAYVARAVFPIPTCPKTSTTTPAPVVAKTWTQPVSAGLVSGFRTVTRPSHDGVDLGAARNTLIKAANGGKVIRVVCNASTNNCDVDGSRSISGCGWYVEVQHALNYVTRYCHMVRKPSVVVGQTVATGQLLGYVGTSGSSSGPHLHFEVHTGTPATHANAIDPIRFMAARGAPIG